jgi:hypothetical protein
VLVKRPLPGETAAARMALVHQVARRRTRQTVAAMSSTDCVAVGNTVLPASVVGAEISYELSVLHGLQAGTSRTWPAARWPVTNCGTCAPIVTPAGCTEPSGWNVTAIEPDRVKRR